MPPRHAIRLQTEELSLSRGDVRLIDGLSLGVGPGEALWLTGPNGIGKTTLLLGLAGLLRPDAGRVDWRVGDQSVRPEHALSYAAHGGTERAGLTLGEDLAFWQRVQGDTETLEKRLDAVGLVGRQDTPVAGLSAGQRRRLSLAKRLGSGRAAWLMDEPLAGLDTDGRSLVTRTLGAHLRNGGMAIIASHQPVPIEDATARRLILEPGA
ncbi:MAG: heme ABC exporter ATP-binding protein CcmA [Litorimonas sp.]